MSDALRICDQNFLTGSSSSRKAKKFKKLAVNTRLKNLLGEIKYVEEREESNTVSTVPDVEPYKFNHLSCWRVETSGS